MDTKNLPYRPIGLLAGMGAGVLAGKVFDRAWTAATGQDEAPDPLDRDRGWGELLLAAAIEGAIFAVVRTAVDRAGAYGVQKSTGTWPEH
ncbi:DUF4235 domain-containing protein [Streptomyces sp. SID3343]|uniref:DUF4235 domain-containing protein n=1 Tax=Streptomyces sp. SID3343 TaxID=2690260 RepID=UPI00136B9089|nr:DUF4235 domain-containing protein [Streptomyces sp. SID3343]MYW00743.1 DUF4235 domain-containing protein [Streptomyces sp. SID3343]